MRVMVFHIGQDRYALPLAAVLRVLPLARLKELPGAPPWVPGLLDLRGEAVPVVDLSALAGRQPGPARHDTRILLVETEAGGRPRRIGLQCEHVTGVLAIAGTLAEAGVRAAPWLGPVAPAADGMLQLLDPARLLAPEVAHMLFAPE